MMATITHHIRSYYDPAEQRDDLLQQTRQLPDTPSPHDPDPWLTEPSFGPNRLTSAPSFVPAVVSYEEVNETMGDAFSGLKEVDPPTVEGKPSEISGWYKSLNRHQQHRSFSTQTIQSPLASTFTSTKTQQTSGPSAPPNPKPPIHRRTEKDWFISNALQSAPSTSHTSTPPPHTLADILDRDPPSHKPHVPPVWIAIDPTNRGFTMLQNSGWSEGEPLGRAVIRRNDHVPPLKHAKVKVAEEVKEEVGCPEESFDGVVQLETKSWDIIDLTISDSSEDEDLEQPLPSTKGSTSLGHGGKALLTPLPTVLKSDRLGIGLKAKKYGPHKASQKRVTHNAAALTAHINAHKDMQKLKVKIGRGSRGFAKLNKREVTNRRNLLAYLNS